MQSERSEGMFCDDIFGETPTGIRKSVSSTPMFLFVIYVLSSIDGGRNNNPAWPPVYYLFNTLFIPHLASLNIIICVVDCFAKDFTHAHPLFSGQR